MLEEKREIAGSSWILAYDSFEPEEEGLREVLSLWQCNYVVVRRDYGSNMLRAEADCLNRTARTGSRRARSSRMIHALRPPCAAIGQFSTSPHGGGGQQPRHSVGGYDLCARQDKKEEHARRP